MKPNKPIYLGSWQYADTIREQLAGPIGQGQVIWDNNDYFEGFFHLSYAHINGSCYAAEGKFIFADKSYIEKAWLVTFTDMNTFELTGVYRVHRPEGIESIALFRLGKRYSVELFLADKPYAIEYYADEQMQRLEVAAYELNEDDPNCISVSITLQDGRRIVQKGGKYSLNNYDERVYDPDTHVTLFEANGDSIDHWGTCLRNLQPYDNYVTIHCKETQQKKEQHWEQGTLKEDGEWTRDALNAWSGKLPNPLGEGEMHAIVWKDGQISYNYGDWEYEGEVQDNRPNGHGVLKGYILYEGQHYEGEFMGGKAHGTGLFINEKANIRLEGEWIDGVYQEPNVATEPIILHAQHGRKHWSVSSDGEWKYEESDIEAKLGRLDFRGFSTYEVARIESDKITITDYGKSHELLKGGKLHLYEEIEGREWSDGCVYDGDEYSLDLTWEA